MEVKKTETQDKKQKCDQCSSFSARAVVKSETFWETTTLTTNQEALGSSDVQEMRKQTNKHAAATGNVCQSSQSVFFALCSAVASSSAFLYFYKRIFLSFAGYKTVRKILLQANGTKTVTLSCSDFCLRLIFLCENVQREKTSHAAHVKNTRPLSSLACFNSRRLALLISACSKLCWKKQNKTKKKSAARSRCLLSATATLLSAPNYRANQRRPSAPHRKTSMNESIYMQQPGPYDNTSSSSSSSSLHTHTHTASLIYTTSSQQLVNDSFYISPGKAFLFFSFFLPPSFACS